MNPGIVLAIGVIAAPGIVLAAYAIGRRRGTSTGMDCAFFAAVAVGVLTLGLTLLAASASRCGSGVDGRWQWQGNTCVDTKAGAR